MSYKLNLQPGIFFAYWTINSQHVSINTEINKGAARHETICNHAEQEPNVGLSSAKGIIELKNKNN